VKKPFSTVRDLRQVKGFLKDILELKRSEDYVFVTLLDETPILSSMEIIFSVFPNALHVERSLEFICSKYQESDWMNQPKQQLSQLELFKGFYKKIKRKEPDEETEKIFQEVLSNLLKEEREK